MTLDPCDLFVLTGERSGDAYGAAILGELRRWRPDLVCAAMGGEALRHAGADIEQDSDGLGIVGFLPVLLRLPEFVAMGHRLAGVIRARQPKVVLSIDYPGFNFRLLRRLAPLRAAGTRFVHLVAPQVWAWRAGRARSIVASIDRLLCFFDFEPPLFVRHGLQADFVGHPLADLVPPAGALRSVATELGLGDADRLVLLAPGSRRREVADILPTMDAAWRLARDRLQVPAGGRVLAVVSKTADLPRELYRQATDLPLVEGDYHACCAAARLGVITSGTATLEAAILGLPHVLLYRSDPVSARIGKHLIRCRHIGLANIVHGRRVCPELLQDECEPTRLAARMIRCWHDPRQTEMRTVLDGTRELLGGGGAMARIAAIIAGELGGSPVRTGISINSQSQEKGV